MEMDFSETQCLMTHYRGQPLKIDEIDILSWLTRLMGLPIKPNCSFTDACGVCLSLSYFQVDNAYTNPSRLTVIIRIIRRADLWYELSWWLLPVEWIRLRQSGQPWQHRPITRWISSFIPQKFIPKIKFSISKYILFFFSNPGTQADIVWTSCPCVSVEA